MPAAANRAARTTVKVTLKAPVVGCGNRDPVGMRFGMLRLPSTKLILKIAHRDDYRANGQISGKQMCREKSRPSP
jgi:hypothetical protein